MSVRPSGHALEFPSRRGFQTSSTRGNNQKGPCARCANKDHWAIAIRKEKPKQDNCPWIIPKIKKKCIQHTRRLYTHIQFLKSQHLVPQLSTFSSSTLESQFVNDNIQLSKLNIQFSTLNIQYFNAQHLVPRLSTFSSSTPNAYFFNAYRVVPQHPTFSPQRCYWIRALCNGLPNPLFMEDK